MEPTVNTELMQKERDLMAQLKALRAQAWEMHMQDRELVTQISLLRELQQSPKAV